MSRQAWFLALALAIWQSPQMVAAANSAAAFGLTALQPKVVPSIGYEIHMALATNISSVCVLGCRQYRQLMLFIPHNISVTLVCDDCTEAQGPNPFGRIARLSESRTKPQVLCAMPTNVTYDAVVLDSHGDSKVLSFHEILGPLTHKYKPNVFLVADWHKRHLAVMSGLHTGLDVSRYSEGASLEGNHANFVFSEIYHTKAWGPDGGASGPGSTLEVTANIRQGLINIVNKYQINSIIDAPCGSMFWMPTALNLLPAHVKYMGMDVACHLISSHRVRFAAKPNWSFHCADVCHQRLPKADLVFSRDAMQHLPLEYVLGFFQQVKASGAKWLLIGSYITGGMNRNIKVGDYFLIDVTKPPFNVQPPPLEIVNEMTHDGKHMLLLNVTAMQWNTDLAGY